MSIFSSIASDATALVNNARSVVTDAKSIVGGILGKPKATGAKFEGATDFRTRIRVPDIYLPKTGPISPLSDPKNSIGGILFPYTPTITVDNKAEYATQNPTHSNYTQYFYKYSSVGPIKITGRFSVQTEDEGRVLLATIHLLRSLTKMRFGDDELAGSPPPVCRLDAYGDYMLQNIPVTVSGWTHELPDSVDYITVGRKGSPTTFGQSMVPVLSTISIDLNVMYSRRELMNHNIPEWLTGGLAGKGYI